MDISDEAFFSHMDSAMAPGGEVDRHIAGQTINRFLNRVRRQRHARAARRALFPAARREVNARRGGRILRNLQHQLRPRMMDIFIEGRRPENAYLFDRTSGRVGEGEISRSSPLAENYRDYYSGKANRNRYNLNRINTAIDWNRNPSIVAATYLQRRFRPRIARMMYARRPHAYFKYK